jgi:hypothetical protein
MGHLATLVALVGAAGAVSVGAAPAPVQQSFAVHSPFDPLKRK